jgi:hypothetical protein
MLEELLESNTRLQGREQEVRGFATSVTSQFRTELVAATEAALSSSAALLASLREGPFGASETSSEEATSIAEETTSECQQLQVHLQLCTNTACFPTLKAPMLTYRPSPSLSVHHSGVGEWWRLIYLNDMDR